MLGCAELRSKRHHSSAMRLTDEQRMLRDTAREFAQKELAPHAAEWDRASQFPAEALAELGRLGFMGMLVPPEYGGAGAGPGRASAGLGGDGGGRGARAPAP